MTTKTPPNIANFQAASTARWLAKALERARADVNSMPTGDAVDRIRARVLGDVAPRKAQPSIAA